MKCTVRWDVPVPCNALLCFGGKEEEMVLQKRTVLAILWVVPMEPNRRIFEEARGEEVDHLWTV